MSEEEIAFIPEGFQIGTVAAGRYRLTRFLGNGGSGFVLLAEDLHLDKTLVVLKFLHSHLVEDERAFQRFRNETSIAFELNHPNIVQTFSFERWDGVGCFITMEYLPDGSMLDSLPQFTGEAFNFARYCSHLNMVLQGLGYAHQSGVVHRDIKPHNLLIAESGSQVKIADFGLSQMMWGETKMTHVGDMVGTPQYMSPEQLEGKAIDRRSDIYSLGITAFELLCGTPPFAGKSLFELAEQHFNQPLPSVQSRGMNVPDWMEQFLIRCTNKNREERFQSLEEAAQFLHEHAPEYFQPLTSGEVATRVPVDIFDPATRQDFRRRVLRVAFYTAVVGLGLFFAIYARKHSQAKRQVTDILLTVEKHTSIPMRLTKKLFDINVSVGDTHLFFENDPGPKGAWSLLDIGLDPNFIGKDGLTPLLWATKNFPFDNEKNTRELLHYGADPDTADDLGRSALMYAVIKLKYESAEALLAGGANINKTDNAGRTALHYATALRNTIYITLLLTYRADPNVQDADGMTPLHIAVRFGDLQTVRALLQAGANPRLANKALKSPLDLAAKTLGSSSEASEMYSLLSATPQG